MAANHLEWDAPRPQSIADLLRARGPRDLVTIGPDDHAGGAVEILRSVGISQLPVLENGRSVGSIQEITLARVLHDRGDPSSVTIREIMARPLPQLDVEVHLDEAYRLLLSGHTGVLAVEGDKVVDIITRIDLIQYWNQLPRS
jgi:cystathionine beta-synthase